VALGVEQIIVINDDDDDDNHQHGFMMKIPHPRMR
jgi:hypothetical protein